MMEEKKEALTTHPPVTATASSSGDGSILTPLKGDTMNSDDQIPIKRRTSTSNNWAATAPDDSSRGETSSLMDAGSIVDGEQSLTRECVEHLMREQDAELLESGPNSRGMTPVLTSQIKISRSMLDIMPPLSLLSVGGGGAEDDQVSVSVKSSPLPKKRLSSRSFLQEEHRTSSASLGDGAGTITSASLSQQQLEEKALAAAAAAQGGGGSVVGLHLQRDPDSVRQTLSGDIWIHQQQQQDYDSDAPCIDDEATNNSSSVIMMKEQGGMLVSDHGGIESSTQNNAVVVGVSSTMKRTESMDRRLAEAAQFAEAVGELEPTEQNELRIIEEDDDDDIDDDDDDDDVPEIRVEDKTTTITTPEGIRTVLSQESLSKGLMAATSGGEQQQPRTQKTRPQWPFGAGGAGNKRIFLVPLPEQKGGQDFVYKGIQSNPPEIVKRGTTRGNYAQLHRKAWLEVSDKYHRYGKNLRLYYRYWERLGCPTNMFFDWLDSKGEAAGQPLPVLDECPRAELDSDTVLYITNPDVTAGYAIKFIPDEKGRGRVVDVDGDPVKTGPDGWIFVLRDNEIYGAQKITSVTGHSKQRFHHSSFFGGKAVAAAGIFITDDDGVLTRLYPHSGHYRPGEAHVQRVLFYLHHAGVDLRTFEMDLQQILHVARDKEPPRKSKDAAGGAKGKEKAVEKKKKVESLHLVSAVLAACFLAHKARFIGNNIFTRIHRIRKADVASVREALAAINY